MRDRKLGFSAAACLCLAAGLGYGIRAFASGIPSTGALSYAGVLEDGTGPVSGSHNLQVILYDAATGGNNLCQSTTAAVTVTDGHFSVLLPDTCTSAVGANPNTWVDVLVDGSDTGRTKIGAVPYAVEAKHTPNADNATSATNASNAAGALATAIGSLQTSVTTLSGQVPLNVFLKGGNNGTATCDAFCAGANWGKLGTCVGAEDTEHGTYISCETAPGLLTTQLNCWCSAP